MHPDDFDVIILEADEVDAIRADLEAEGLL